MFGLPAWEVGAAANAVIAGCYFAISWLIFKGMAHTGQLGSNRLAAATALIFFTCAVHHGSHTVHVLLPLVTSDAQGVAMRAGFGWQMDVWDIFGAAVAVGYLSLRSSYGRLLVTPTMFGDLRQEGLQRVIAEERAALEEAQSVARVGSFRIDLASGRVTRSQEWLRITGIEDSEVNQRSLWELVHPDDRARVHLALQTAQRSGEPVDELYRLQRLDGSELTLHLRARVERDDTGAAVSIAGTAQDVTDKVRVEQALSEAEQRFRGAFEHAPIGVCLVSLAPGGQGRVTQSNASLAGMLGRAPEDLDGSPLSTMIHPDDTAQLSQGLQALCDGEVDRIECEQRFMHREGHFVWALVSAAVLNPVDGARAAAITHVLDISDRKRSEGQLQYLADHDALTGLYNRRRFSEELERALAGSKRYRESGAILIIDLDGFKFVNDSSGHAAGDELLKRTAALFQGALRETDVLARLGGDEFAVLLPRADESAAVEVADKLLAAIRREGLAVTEERHARISTSIGIALFTTDRDCEADELMADGDIAMYEAKEAGKDRYVVNHHTEGDRARVSVRENWNQRLREALDDNQFVLHAQIIQPICGNGVPRYELLLRLPDDHGDLIPPGTFLYNAERFGLIERIDRWVITQAVLLLEESHQAGQPLALAVNMSGKTMSDPAIGEFVARLLAQHPIPAGSLIAEITETAAIVQIERARTLAHTLRALGCRLALDDFGAGFASFYYLEHLEFDYLKIDGEFIRGLVNTPTDRLVVNAVVDIARGMGTETVAEFVGSDDTLELLKDSGVHYGQGYHLGRPGPIPQVIPHLARERQP